MVTPDGLFANIYSISPEEVAGRVNKQPSAMISLPYVHGVTDTLKRVLEPFCIRTVMKPYLTLKQRLVHPKDGEVNCSILHSLCELSCQLCKRD